MELDHFFDSMYDCQWWISLVCSKSIPIGTAYAVWTGIGAVGTLLVGILFFQDSASILRLLSALLIVVGIIGLKLF
nr:SMR family transporter [Chryseobacterium sp. PCH239]